MQHGGDLTTAMALHGGTRGDWLDLSTGINPHAFPLPDLPAKAWTALPDEESLSRLTLGLCMFCTRLFCARIMFRSGETGVGSGLIV